MYQTENPMMVNPQIALRNKYTQWSAEQRAASENKEERLQSAFKKFNAASANETAAKAIPTMHQIGETFGLSL